MSWISKTYGLLLASRFSQIDELTRPDHFYLDGSDACYYIGEYTARQNHAFSATNQLILNFKKGMERRGKYEWKYKEQAIRQAAGMLREAISANTQVTFVPVPPSKCKTDPLYDDRMLRTLQQMCVGWQHADIRELVTQVVSVEPTHLSDRRHSIQELIDNYQVDGRLTHPAPATIAVVDDVLTTGRHFKAMKSVLAGAFPRAQIVGVFIARRVPEAIDWGFDVIQ